jgi:hypothetical protein
MTTSIEDILVCIHDEPDSQGNSQSGRYLRDFLYSGFNEDEEHRIVFDGSIPTVAYQQTIPIRSGLR